MQRTIKTCFSTNRGLLGGLALTAGHFAGCNRSPQAIETVAPGRADHHVYVNGVALPAETLQVLQQQFGVQARPGRYWYDQVCGAVGFEGQGTTAFLPAGLRLGGPLKANASNGSSRVFVNGRELTTAELAGLEQLVPVPLGRYWLDASGNAGMEGGPATCNLIQISRQSQGSHSSRSSTTGIGVVGQGNFVGVIGEGWSVTVGD